MQLHLKLCVFLCIVQKILNCYGILACGILCYVKCSLLYKIVWKFAGALFMP